jgi:hypothetical protein
MHLFVSILSYLSNLEGLNNLILKSSLRQVLGDWKHACRASPEHVGGLDSGHNNCVSIVMISKIKDKVCQIS